MTAVSDQTRRSRSEAGRKAAEAKKRKRAFAEFMATGTPVGPVEYQPGGSAVGTERQKVTTVSEILARVAAVSLENIRGARVSDDAGRDGGSRGASEAVAVPTFSGQP